MAENLTKIKSMARAHTETAIKVLAGIMEQPTSPESARVAAANSLLDRGWGKAAQALIGGDEDDPAIKLATITRVIVDKSGNSDGGGVPPAAGAGPL